MTRYDAMIRIFCVEFYCYATRALHVATVRFLSIFFLDYGGRFAKAMGSTSALHAHRPHPLAPDYDYAVSIIPFHPFPPLPSKSHAIYCSFDNNWHNMVPMLWKWSLVIYLPTTGRGWNGHYGQIGCCLTVRYVVLLCYDTICSDFGGRERLCVWDISLSLSLYIYIYI